MAGTVRLLSVRAVLMMLAVIVAAIAVAGALSPASSGHHGTALGSGKVAAAGKVSPRNIIWN